MSLSAGRAIRARPQSLLRIDASSSRTATPQTPPSSCTRQSLAPHGRGLSTSSAPRSRNSFATALVIGVVGAGAYLAGAFYPPAIVTMVNPRPAPAAPGVDTEEGRAHTASIEAQLMSLPQVRALLASNSPVAVEARPTPPPASTDDQAIGSNPSTQVPSLETTPSDNPHYIASRPYRNYPPSKLLHSLTAGTLRGPGRFAVAPLVLAKTTSGASALGGNAGDCHVFVHLGRSLCGHDGIVHGGLLATLCDEALARTAFVSLPAHVGVTARLEVDYKAPTMADQFVVLETKLVQAKGRKAEVVGTLRDLQGKELVRARAVFVQPKFANMLDTSLVKSAMDADMSREPGTAGAAK